ncbi:hypothetical protein H4R34_002225 [Dimargaris verticillata]|uniref:tRNA (guanine(10)-N(2))-methyltransferase n=1 Tax=Dimargaris verticillata TaxID=2761393 RepID=A0A9W8ED29_9FUNG|nr:hypothetical protein H4R34_002225 [Dimargaris verticillata]
MRPYLVHFAQFHADFRLAEIEALARLEGVTLQYDPAQYRSDNPFMVVYLESNAAAAQLVHRAILVKEICEHWGSAETYEALFAQLKTNPERWEPYHTCSFRFEVKGFGGTLSLAEQIAIIERFSFLGFDGPIDLKNPKEQFFVYEDYGIDPTETNTTPHVIHFGRLVARSNRNIVQKFNLKKRKYLGNTSMDAELSLVMANQALARPGTVIYDPFVGTGSFLLTCAHFGALTMGSDIDGRQIRGSRTKTAGITDNVKQYGLDARVLDTLVFDICRNPWRHTPSRQPWFDAIVTDPPYGVRAGAKRLGRKTGLNPDISFRVIDGQLNHQRDDYYPPTIPYEMSEVLVDLLEFAARHLAKGGRLVYWLPTVVDEYTVEDVPLHPCLALVANSEQPFGSWSRRLITMEKVRDWEPTLSCHSPHFVPPPSQTAESPASLPALADTATGGAIYKPASGGKNALPGHFNFREKYFYARSHSPYVHAAGSTPPQRDSPPS